MDEKPPYDELIERLRARLGPHGVLTGAADTAPYCEDWRRLYRGRTPAVLRPATTAEVADAVRLCAEEGVPIVPQGGNTSMVGGAAVSEDGTQIILSLSRMNKVRAIDIVDMTMEIEAGVTLKAAQDAATEASCLLPLSISSEGSAQIGGVLATNAGGNNTVRYGNARDLVLGLEVVLPDGQVWNGLRRLHKDNTGYCLRQLFVGSEGTLGIITAAVLKLYPRLARPRLRSARSPPRRRRSICSTDCSSTTPRRCRPMNTCRAPGSISCCATSPAPRCRSRRRRNSTR
jgi:FAD/FMN-containing dehydrogenase